MQSDHLAHAFGGGIQIDDCGALLSMATALRFGAAIPEFESQGHHTIALLSCDRSVPGRDPQPRDGQLAIPTTQSVGVWLSRDAEWRMIKADVKLG